MSWVTVGVAVASTAYSAYDSNKKSKEAKSMQQQAMGAAGKRPEAAELEEVDLRPVNFQNIQGDTLRGNLNYMGLIQQLMAGNAGINRQTSMNRAAGFDPSLWSNVGKQSQLAGDYLSGNIPVSDIMQRIAMSTGATGAVGTPGAGQALTARDLGLFDMDIRQRGAEMNARAAQQAEMLDPRAAYGAAADFQITPSQAIPWKINENLKLTEMALGQAENMYTAEQSANNIRAGVDPRMVAGLPFQPAANQSVNWGQIISGLGSAYQSYQNRPEPQAQANGTYSTKGQAKRAAPNAAGYSQVDGGYVPKAKVVS